MIEIFKNQIPYDNIKWDVMDYKKREKLALDQLIQTTLFAKKAIPFYKQHLNNFSKKDIINISSLEEYALTIPETTKNHLSTLPCSIFVPYEKTFNLINKGTGGTTSQPVSILFSKNDWKAMAQHIARSIKFDFKDNLKFLKNTTCVALYHGNHITADIYKEGLKLLNIHLYERTTTKNDINSIYKFIQEIKPNWILGPPEDKTKKQTKGLTIDNLLSLDARNLTENAYRLNSKINPKFYGIFWSSMPISNDFQNYILNHLSVKYQQAQYGSTEVCPTGATCSKYPKDFHLGYGPTVSLVKHPSKKKLINEDEEGYIVVSKTGSNINNKNGVPTGTVLLNYRTGDYGYLKNQYGKKCECGRNTPILYNLHRIENLASKLKNGCQVD
ncbi:MAG: hypothetical protein ACOC3Z_02230 [Nanoarchaeota archaeon]